MSEGARYAESVASLRLRLSDQRRPTLPAAAGPERADEGGGPDVGRLETGSESYFVAPGTSRLSLRAASKRLAASSQFQQFQTTSKKSVLRFSYWR